MTPSRESVYIILNEDKEPVALVRNKIMYSVDILDDDGIVETFMNGGDAFPLISKPV